MVQRDFIISALHRIGPMALPEALPSVETNPAYGLDWIEQTAEEIAVGVTLAGRTVYDVERLFKKLKDRALFPELSPATSALVIDRTLALLPKGPAADVAIRLTGALREDEIHSIGRAGLLALRDAACLAPPEESEAAVAQIDEELERRGPVACRDVGGTWLIAEGAHPDALDFAHERLNRMHGRPLLSSAIAGLAVMVTPEAERHTDRRAVLAHLKALSRRDLDPTLATALSQLHENNVTTLEEAKVMKDAFLQSRWARHAQTARILWRQVATRLRVGPEPLVATD
jgi:hypothetical protein